MRDCFKYIIITINIGLKVELMAQPSFSIDSSFSPTLDFTGLEVFGGGSVNDVWENPKNAQIYLAGDFNRIFNGKRYDGNVCFTSNGSICYLYDGSSGSDLLRIFPISDTTLISLGPSSLYQRKYNGEITKTSWFWNLFKSVPCKRGYSPYFFKDGSALMANGKASTNHCNPKYMGDTLPHQYIVKVDPQGIYDSTFNHTMNDYPTGFFSYDSNQILIYGLPRRFTVYEGITIDGICRTDLNGDLDTTFISIFNPGNGGFYPELVQSDGKILIRGNFQLKNYPGQWFSLIRLKVDGSLDTTFMNFGGPIDSTLIAGSNVLSIVKTPDKGYLVAGYFNKYQGYAKNGIAKIDSNGKVEPQYFTSIGPDSSVRRNGAAGIHKIIPSINGGYYLGGSWRYWDGKPTQPIIKIHGLNTGVGLDDKNLHKKTQYLNTIYPNPTNAIINLEWLPNQKINQISLFDLQGRLIKNYANKVNQINLESIENGIYFLKVFGEEGVEVRKIVKSN